MFRRRRIQQTESLQDRLASFAKRVREKASLLPPGAEKDDLLRVKQTPHPIHGWEVRLTGVWA
jgi:hypothetical protein